MISPNIHIALIRNAKLLLVSKISGEVRSASVRTVIPQIRSSILAVAPPPMLRVRRSVIVLMGGRGDKISLCETVISGWQDGSGGSVRDLDDAPVLPVPRAPLRPPPLSLIPRPALLQPGAPALHPPPLSLTPPILTLSTYIHS